MEASFRHYKSFRTDLTFLAGWVPGGRRLASNTISEVVIVGSSRRTNATESSWVIDQMSRTGDTGFHLGIPDGGGRALDAVA